MSLDRMEAAPWNPRRHDERNLQEIRLSLKRFGQLKPVVCRPMTGGGMQLVAGHGTVTAARELGWSKIRAWVAEMSDIEARAFAVQDNRTTDLSDWDPAALLRIVREDQMGFDDDEVQQLYADVERELGQGAFADEFGDWQRPKEHVEDDEIPEKPREPVTKPGELWLLGRHRLLCGDSTDPEAVGRLLGDTKPFLMVTDPPYGVEYDPEWRKRAGMTGTSRRGVANDDLASWKGAYKLFPGAVAYVWHASLFAPVVLGDLEECGFESRSQVIWAKNRFAISRGHYHWQHEPCWYVVRKGSSAKWEGDRKQSTLWSIDMPPRSEHTEHGTQKPVECMARPIRNHGKRADHVYDPFLGSGTTLVAAEQLGRTCFGLELDPGYADVIIERWQTLTGKSATRAP